MAYRVPIGYFDEGQQAEEYKARKAKEAEDKAAAEKERDDHRYRSHISYGRSITRDRYTDGRLPAKDLDKFNDEKSRALSSAGYVKRETGRRADDLKRVVDKIDSKGTESLNRKDAQDYLNAENLRNQDRSDKHTVDKMMDVANRHIRRHPQKESCGIFESVLLYDESFDD